MAFNAAKFQKEATEAASQLLDFFEHLLKAKAEVERTGQAPDLKALRAAWPNLQGAGDSLDYWGYGPDTTAVLYAEAGALPPGQHPMTREHTTDKFINAETHLGCDP